WNDVILAYRNGAPVRISDVGHAVDGAENNKMGGWYNGKPAIILLVYKLAGANVIDTVAGVQAAMPRILHALPPAIKVDTVMDRTQTIRASVHDVNITLMISITLVILVIFLFLRNFWATVIPGVTVPLALVGTFGLMYLAKFSLDNLSLMALTIAVGF